MATLAMVGLGRMGANMVRRLRRDSHRCVVFDCNTAAATQLAQEGAEPAASLADLAQRLTQRPRAVWLMLPAGAVEAAIIELQALLDPGDVIIDGGNSNFRDAVRRARSLAVQGIRFIDVGTSGGIWGLQNGYCLMIGGDLDAVRELDPVFAALAGGNADSDRSTAPAGYLHCGPSGAGHFVKMVHNGIEYGMMAAFAEGFNILRHANAGATVQEHSAEVTPLAEPDAYRYEFPLADIAELWRHGSVVRSWLLDLIAEALPGDPDLSALSGEVADSGEGRWTVQTAVEVGVPVPVLSAALFARFSSRGADDFANKILSAMRLGFGGHIERSTK